MTDPLIIAAIRAKQASLADALLEAERRAEQLRADMATLDATLRIFDPSNAPRPAPKAAGSFRHGAFSRTVLDTLRRATSPLTARDIATSIAAAHGVDVSTSAAMQGFIGRVRSALDRERDGITREKQGDVIVWRAARCSG